MGLDLNLKHLEYFITVARMGSINKAAQAHFISQPYLGRIIKELENMVGTILFQRTRGGVTLTPDGQTFFEHAQNITGEMDRLQALKRPVDSVDHSLTVSMVKYSHIMECFIDVVLKHADESSFVHRLDEGTVEEVIEDVYSGQANIGVIYFDGTLHNEVIARLAAQFLNYHFLCHIKPHILISKNHPLLREGKPVNLKTLAPYGFARQVGQCEDFTYRIISQSSQYNLNYSSRIVYLTGRPSLLRLIANSDFYGIGIHDFSDQISAYHVLSIPIEDCQNMMEFGYILSDGAAISPIANDFIQDLIERFSGQFNGQ